MIKVVAAVQPPHKEAALIGWIRALVVAVPLFCVAFCFADTLHWPLVNDMALMHYGCFLIHHGMVLYKNIQEINMPGTYLVDCTVIDIIGRSAVAWRCYDYFILVSATLAMISIASSLYGWLGGMWGGMLFALYNAKDGIAQNGQRDLTIAALLLLSYAFVLWGINQQKHFMISGAGILACVACLIKPTVVPFLAILLIAIAFHQRHSPALALRDCALFILGIAVPFVYVFHMLYAGGSFKRSSKPWHFYCLITAAWGG